MTRARHRIENVNREVKEGDCSVCGRVRVYENKQNQRWVCSRKVYESNKAWKKNNPEKLKASGRRYAAKHPELRKAAGQRYREKHPDRVREFSAAYRANNIEKVRQAHWRRRGILSPATGEALTQQEFDAAFESQGLRCAICLGGNSAPPWSADHDHATGMFRGVLCRVCNISLGYYEKLKAAPGEGLSVLLQEYLDAHRGRQRLVLAPPSGALATSPFDDR